MTTNKDNLSIRQDALTISKSIENGLNNSYETAKRADHKQQASHIGVVAVDDAKMFLHGIHSLLSTEGDMTLLSAVETGSQAVRAVVEFHPHVLLVDLRIKWVASEPQPEINVGLRTIREALRQDPDLAILVLTSFSDKRWLVQAIDAGAAGFLPKECDPYDIVRSIRDLYQGRTVLTSEQLGWLRETQGLLTVREQEILQAITQGEDDETIANALHIKVSTVRKHIENIRIKLHARNRLEVVIEAIRQGLA